MDRRGRRLRRVGARLSDRAQGTLGRLVLALASQHQSPDFRRPPGELIQQPGLATPRFPFEKDQAALAMKLVFDTAKAQLPVQTVSPKPSRSPEQSKHKDGKGHDD